MVSLYTLTDDDTIHFAVKWKILPKISDDLTEQLLANRGIKTSKERNRFFNPKISDFKKDLEISGISRAQERIKKAIKNNELIVVYGDYDVDGIAACAILYKALTQLGAKVLPYIPHREKEGYGLSEIGLKSVKANGASVVITVDNGIVAFKQANFAKNLGLDLIITDHHQPQEEKPEAYAIVHSTKMCGAGVAWCLIQEIIKEDLRQDLLQFVAIATVCDLMPLINLGRALVIAGLKILNHTNNLGLLALISEAGISFGNISTYEIGYIIGPRLNAIGRLEHALDALRLLCTKDPLKAKRLAKLLSQTNTLRQQLTVSAIKEAKVLVQSEKNIQVLSSQNWSAGVIGLIAGKITEKYWRPTIAISVGETISKGSARSIDGINIVEVIRKHSDILIDVGGHPGAAGFSIHTSNIETFKKRLEKEIIEAKEQVLEIDAEVAASELTKKLVVSLQKFEPFGFGNPRPTFASCGVQISDIRIVGVGKHLKFKVSTPVILSGAQRSEGSKPNSIDCIAFGMGNLAEILPKGQSIDLAYTPEIDDYNGLEKLQLKVKDIRVV